MPSAGRSGARVVGWRRWLLCTGLALTLVNGCGGGSRDRSSPQRTPSVDTEARPARPQTFPYGYRLVATADQPTAIAPLPGSDLVFLAERRGRVWLYRIGEEGWTRVSDVPALDISDRVESGYEEEGLLGLAVAPDGSWLALSFVDTTQTANVERYRLDPAGGVEGDSTRVLVSQRLPEGNTHGGGGVEVGPDSMLYVGFGDNRGSSAGGGTAGGWSRIDRVDPVTGTSSTWVAGLRNPWRFSFDVASGSLWVGDVGGGIGGDDTERIYRLPADRPSDVGPTAAKRLDPVVEYDQSDDRCAVVGGFAQNGPDSAVAPGRYVFLDYCGGLLAVDVADPGPVTVLAPSLSRASGLGRDDKGRLYGLSLDGRVWAVVAAADSGR